MHGKLRKIRNWKNHRGLMRKYARSVCDLKNAYRRAETKYKGGASKWLKKKKYIVSTIVNGLVESTKNQHQITKARHAYAKKSPAEKQRIGLAELQSRNNLG